MARWLVDELGRPVPVLAMLFCGICWHITYAQKQAEPQADAIYADDSRELITILAKRARDRYGELYLDE